VREKQHARPQGEDPLGAWLNVEIATVVLAILTIIAILVLNARGLL